MTDLTVPHQRYQVELNRLFQAQSSYWKDIYTARTVQAAVFRDRQARVLAWSVGLGLAPGARVLEIGCGAGFLAIALAQRGFRVDAIDPVAAMVELTRKHAAESATTDLLSASVGDVHSLAFEDSSFDLVIAIGVLPWVNRLDVPLREMARVARPGGHVIIVTIHWAGLHYFLEPLRNRALRPLAQRAQHALVGAGMRHPSPHMNFHSRRFIDAVLAQVGLAKIRDVTLGFGPFSLLNCNVLPEPFATTLHYRLQRLADRGVPGLRSTGGQYLVLARKLPTQPNGAGEGSQGGLVACGD